VATAPAVASLADVIGSRITRVRRVHYAYRGVPDTDFGPLELTFGDRVVLLDNAADGETLRVRTEAWEDPFAGPLSVENRAFVEESGKWTVFDVSAQGAFATFIGDVLVGVEPVLAESGKVTGMILRTGGGGVVRVDAEADELFINEVIPGRPTREPPTVS
jgi:hypothetical protein